MKDTELQINVGRAIKWEPLLRATQLDVAVEDGIVTLTGIVDSYSKKIEAEGAAKSVIGVRGVVQKIDVDFGLNGKFTDADITAQADGTLKRNWQLSGNDITVTVENGWVSLDGEVNWNYQREAAGGAVVNVQGVRGVSNNITIKQESKDSIESLEIENAMVRNTAINNQKITVIVTGSKVALTGTVSSWYQKEQAEKIAWKAPGVWTVENDLVVESDEGASLEDHAPVV